jgi:signal recognition particle subunit SRP19
MDPSSFVVIYPSYFDSTKTVKEGRRVSIEDSVPTPTVSDMSLALQQLGVRHVVQPYKGYPRDLTCLWDNPGRVKVELLKMSDDTANKKALIRAMAQRIPMLPSRMQRLAIAQKEAEEVAAKEAEETRALQLKQQQQQQQRQAAANSKSSKKKSSKKKK